MKRLAPATLLAASLLGIGCASKGVDLDEAARLMGREGDVRIDAQITNLDASIGSNLGLTYEIENLRSEPIAVADMIPEVTYDTDSGVVTILIGSEVPGNEFLPRLDLIRSGERRTFTAGANMAIGSTARTAPRAVRIRLSYLRNVEPFEFLVEIPEKAIHDPDKADELFLPWVDNVQSVTTNEVPLEWNRRSGSGTSATSTRPQPRRPPGSGSPF